MSNVIKKQLCACIYLYQKCAVKNFNDHSIVSEKPAELAKYYCNNGSDRIIVFDLSNNDFEQEEALDIIKEIALASEVPVIGAGNIERVENVKKLLYAGCSKAILNFKKDNNIALAEEVSKRFGKDKIAASYSDKTEIVDNIELINNYISELICVNEEIIEECSTLSSVPSICCIKNDNDNKFIELIKSDGISGITGSYINDNIERIFSIKLDLAEQKLPVSICEAKYKWSDLKLNSDGMLPVVVQDYRTNEVLQVAYMNEAAYLKTLELGKMTYWSRSRNELWTKGETSGHFQYVKSLTVDCDYDTMLAKVAQIGAACHTGRYSCFFNTVLEKEYNDTNPLKVFENVYNVISDRKQNPKEGSYTNYLFDKGLDKILKKLGEEATEIVIAAKNPNTNEIKYEISDFLYHMMVLMVEKNISWNEIMTELSNR